MPAETRVRTLRGIFIPLGQIALAIIIKAED